MAHLKPVVSVICISYNHENYISAALESVANQTYTSIELIVVDNNSTDRTLERIQDFVRRNPATKLILNSSNLGVCRAFNQGLALASGRYVIDLSADDVLHPERVARQVAAFERLPDDYAVVFSNAAFINQRNELTGYHYPITERKTAAVSVPSGWVFRDVLASYFVCTPTMMMRKDVLDHLGGYDESLAYEDFDFWVRTARHYRYHYLDEVLTSKRILSGSLSGQFAKPGNPLLESTLSVCYKAFDQCQTPEEYSALARRIRWFIRQCFYAQEYELAEKYRKLLSFMEEPDWLTNSILRLCRWRVPVNGLYNRYLRLRKAWDQSML